MFVFPNFHNCFLFFKVFPDHPKVPPGWVYGECKDRKGLFPANYAEKLPESKGDYVDITPVPSSSSQPSTGRRSVSSIIAALNSQDKLPIAPSMPAEGEREVKEEIKPQVIVQVGILSDRGSRLRISLRILENMASPRLSPT